MSCLMTWPYVRYLPKLTVPAENPNFLLALLCFPDCNKNIQFKWVLFLFFTAHLSFFIIFFWINTKSSMQKYLPTGCNLFKH